jgi:3-oxoacyl-[acyl-carrier-protein] synthase II
MTGRQSRSRAVAVTGIGIVTSLGAGREENWRQLAAGRSGIRRITRFDTAGLRTTIGGCVDGLGLELPSAAPFISLAMARAVAAEAIAEAGIGEPGRFPGGLFLAAPPLEHEWPQRMRLAERARGDRSRRTYQDLFTAAGQDSGDLHDDFCNGTIADRLADELGTEGSPITANTACASGATAIQLGVESIRRGAAAALAIGTDGSLHVEALVRFSLLAALSTANAVPEQAAKPFAKNRDGFVMAEGAAALVLEDAESATARGAGIIGYVLGCGEAADNFHRTRSNPSGDSIVQSMERAIADAGLAPADIAYINAHGTGTPENDKMEALGVHRLFGQHADRLAISANKSMIGHTLTAAGAVEASFTLLALRDGLLPPTINHAVPDPAIGLDVVPNQARRAAAEFALSNSFGFGGQNVSLVFGATPGG